MEWIRRHSLSGKIGHTISLVQFLSILSETIGEMDEYYLHLSSEDYTNLFPQNTEDWFTVQLPNEITLGEGRWKIALIDIKVKDIAAKWDFYVICSLCDIDQVHNVQILRRVWVKGSKKSYQDNFDFPFYVPIKTESIKTFSIVIQTTHAFCTKLPVGSCQLTLHIKTWVKNW